MFKMYTKNKKWILVEGERRVEFDTARDAWWFIYHMRGIRPNVPQVPKSIYPVKTLNPFPSRKKKKVKIKISQEG